MPEPLDGVPVRGRHEARGRASLLRGSTQRRVALWTPRIGEDAARLETRSLWFMLCGILPGWVGLVLVFASSGQPNWLVWGALFVLMIGLFAWAVRLDGQARRSAAAALGVPRRALRLVPLWQTAKFDRWAATGSIWPRLSVRTRDLVIGTLGLIAIILGIGAASLPPMFLGILAVTFAVLSVIHRQPGR